MARFFRVCISILLFVLAVASICNAGDKDSFPPIPGEDLAMKDFAPLPGAHAVILIRQVEGNDRDGWERHFYRIKVLDEEGKKYANIETETYPKQYRITNIQARTIRPDGTIVPFQGQVFDKTIAKYKGYVLYSKALSLPDVQVGTIIDYQYTVRWNPTETYPLDTWTVLEPLPSRITQFSRVIFGQGVNIAWTVFFLGPNEQPKEEYGVVRLSLNNLPAFEKEEYAPPEKELQPRVEFVYSFTKVPNNAEEFWKEKAQNWTNGAEDFMNKRKAAEREVARLVAASDSSEAKLQKLYDRIQSMRNLTYEELKSEKEQQRENLKDNNNIEDVLKHEYGYHNQLNRTFVALARAAGFDATLMRVVERDRHFFHMNVLSFDNLDTELSVITLNGKTLYLDPATPSAPFGLLAWEDTGVKGLLLDKKNAVWASTPQPDPAEGLTKRTADLVLDEEGNLKGRLIVEYHGRVALYRRLQARGDDDAQRKKELEDVVKNWLPPSATVELNKIDDWNAAKDNFTVEANIALPGFAAVTGKRTLVPLSIFPGSDRNPFTSAKRTYPVYFSYSYIDSDVVRIKYPEGMRVESAPQSKDVNSPFGTIKVTVSKEPNTVSMIRDVTMKGYYFAPENYPFLRTFLDKIKAIGDEQAVLRANPK